MNIKTRFSTIFFLLFLALAGSLQAQDVTEEAKDVEVRIFLIDVEQVDTVTQSFTANLTLVLRWHDPALAHEGPTSISRSLDDIWFPRIQILNQQKLTLTMPRSVEVFPGGEVVQRQRYWGSFSQPMDLRLFPFDSQKLKVTIANVGFGGEVVNLIPSPISGISNELTLPDWSVIGWDFVTTDISFEDESSSFDGMIFSLDVKRDVGYFKYKVIFPLILIVMMSWLVFWIDPSLAASQISVSVTAMLTMIAYRFALAGMLPRLAILTSLDHFVLASTLMVFLAMLEVVYTAHLSTNGQLEKARKVDRHARWVAPIIYVSMAAGTLYFNILV